VPTPILTTRLLNGILASAEPLITVCHQTLTDGLATFRKAGPQVAKLFEIQPTGLRHSFRCLGNKYYVIIIIIIIIVIIIIIIIVTCRSTHDENRGSRSDDCIYLCSSTITLNDTDTRGTRERSVEALCYTPEGRGIASR
jgi:hypothetical protein